MLWRMGRSERLAMILVETNNVDFLVVKSAIRCNSFTM
jgi:hypothetical protein